MDRLEMFSLKGKTALVTGGAGLYGQQIVLALAEAGAKTYVASRNLKVLEELVGEDRTRGLDVTALQYDQAEEGSIQGMVGPDPFIYRGTEMSGWYPDYFFHKGGMINFTRFIASYYEMKNVRCNCISPGGFRTEKMPEAFVRQYSEKTFLGRLAGGTDLMGIIIFLASDASAYITGTNIPVDGGYTAK